MAFSYKNSKGTTYYLHSMEVKLKGSGKKQRIFWFARKADSRALDAVPGGYKVVQSKRTGLPLLKRG